MSRENEEIDLKRMLELFDAALASEDPRIKEQLRKLLLVVALIEPDVTPGNTQQRGPLSTLYSRIYELEDRLRRIEMSTQQYGGKYTSPGTYVAPGTYTWHGSNVAPHMNPWTYTLSSGPNITGTNITISSTATAAEVSDLQVQLDMFENSSSTKI